MPFGVASSYPGGFERGVAIREMPIINGYGGEIVWVDSGSGADQGAGTFRKPYATLDYAVGQMTANNGDVIMIKAGHAETVSAHDFVDVDVAGLEIIGLGQGANRPTFTWTTAASAAASSFTIGASNTTIRNLRFVNSDTGNDTTSAVEVGADTTGIDDVTIANCEFDDSTGAFLYSIRVQDGQNRCVVNGCKFINLDTAGDAAVGFTATATAVEGCAVINCWIDGDYNLGAIDLADDTAVFGNILIADNYVTNRRAGGYAIDMDTTGSATNVTGIIARNNVSTDVSATSIYYGGADLVDNRFGLNDANDVSFSMVGQQKRAYKFTMLHDTADDELFEVDGGPVIITGITLVSETAGEAGANFTNLSQEIAPTASYFSADLSVSVDNEDFVAAEFAVVTNSTLSVVESGDTADAALSGMNWLLADAQAVAWEAEITLIIAEGISNVIIDYISLGGDLEIE